MGNYRIIFIDAAGNQSVSEFEKLYTMNTFAIVLVVCAVTLNLELFTLKRNALYVSEIFCALYKPFNGTHKTRKSYCKTLFNPANTRLLTQHCSLILLEILPLLPTINS